MNCNGKERYSDGSAELKLFSLKELGKYIRALVLFGKALLLGPCVPEITTCRECRLAPLATDHQKPQGTGQPMRLLDSFPVFLQPSYFPPN